MRMTQYQGFTQAAHEWLNRNCEAITYTEFTRRVYSDGRKETLLPRVVNILKSEETDNIIYGLCDEEVRNLKRYPLKKGGYVEEYLQAEIWSSGPCMFMALRFSDTKIPINASLWPQKALDAA